MAITALDIGSSLGIYLKLLQSAFVKSESHIN